MSVTHTVTRTYKDQSANAIQQVETVTDSFERNMDVAAPIATNTQYNIALTAAKLQSVALYSDQALTIKTNSSGSPQETITLVAGQTLIWTRATDGAGKIPFAGDVTAMFVTNASSAVAAFKVRAIQSN